MDKNSKLKLQRMITLLFTALTIGFIILMSVNSVFFDWAFRRHENLLSWYIRPIIILPLCYFSYKRSGLGLSATAFLGLTSMFWFPQPESVAPHVIEFLAMEKEYLTSAWTIGKIAISSIVPISLCLLCFAFWKRKLMMGIVLVILIAFGKVVWSFYEGGQTGMSTIAPALLGLIFCLVVIGYYLSGRRKAEKVDI